jgi:hypothetical protein
MKSQCLLPAMLALCSCLNNAHRFDVVSDEPIASATVELNGKSAQLRISESTHAVGELTPSGDAHGVIRVQLISGRTANCRIGYVTSGEPEPHRFKIAGGKCAWISDA